MSKKTSSKNVDKIEDDGIVFTSAGPRLSDAMESKIDEVKQSLVEKINKEIESSHETREYITQKYAELCDKIKKFTEIDSTVSIFRCEVKNIEGKLEHLLERLGDVEKASSKLKSLDTLKKCRRLSSRIIAVEEYGTERVMLGN